VVATPGLDWRFDFRGCGRFVACVAANGRGGYNIQYDAVPHTRFAERRQLLTDEGYAMTVRRGFSFAALLVGLSLAPPDLAAQVVAEHRVIVPGLSEIDDPLEPLAPRAPRTEEELDEVDALALFAAGRMAEDQDELSEALRLYERAYRRNPEAIAPLKQIVPLAMFRLRHGAEGLRYAIKLADRDDSDPVLLRTLSALLVEQGNDDPAAARLLEKAASLAAASEEPGAQYLHLAKLARVYSRMGDNIKAAEALAKVEDALADREKHELTNEQVEEILNEPERSDERFGDIYLAAGQFDRARAAFDRAYAANEDVASASLRAAQIAHGMKDDDEALRQIDRYAAANKLLPNTAPYRLLAEIFTAQNRSAELVPKLEALYAKDKSDPALANFLAEQYLAASEWDKAEAVYEAFPEGSGYYTQRGFVEAYFGAKKYQELFDLLAKEAASEQGLEVLDEQVTKIAANAEALDALTMIAREQLKSEADPLNFGEAYSIATLALEAKRLDAAKEFFALALPQAEGDKKSQTVMAWGIGLLLAEDYAGAVEAFQRGIDEKLLPEDNPTFHYFMAGPLEMLGRTDEALAAARECDKVADRAPRFAVRLPWVLYHARRYDEAEAAYLKVIETFDEEHSYDEYREIVRDARLALSNIAAVQKNYPEAEEWLEQVLDEFPDDIGAANDLGYLWSDQGKRLNRSLAMLQFAVSKAPENPAYRDSLGWVLHKLGRHAEALPEIEKAAAEKDVDGVILDHLGDVHHALGNTAQAQENYTKAIAAFERDKEPEQAETVRKKLTK
jgi:tetratricopeptide (TPR) repeat protein